MRVKFAELQDAYQFANAGPDGDTEAYVDTRTGEFHYHSELLGDEHEDNALPADIENAAYVAIPRKNDLDLGFRLVFAFVGDTFPDDYDDVRDMFRGRGAYGQFKNWLARRGALDAWYAYENNAEEAALRDWAAAMEIVLEA